MPPHPRIVSFFNGAVDELRAAYKKSEGAPKNCMGSLREFGVRRAIKHSLPGSLRLFDGEVIDAGGGRSGQLDGIVVGPFGPVLATAEDEPRIVFAEGVVAVLESKSDISDQWDQVHTTWRQLAPLRRAFPTLSTGEYAPPNDRRIPLVIFGFRGWAKEKTIQDNVVDFVEAFPEGSPALNVAQLDPPGIAFVTWELLESGLLKPSVGCRIYPEDERWRTLAHIWWTLTFEAQRNAVRFPASGYFDDPSPESPSVQANSG